MSLHLKLLILHTFLLTSITGIFQSSVFKLVEDNHRLDIPVLKEYSLQSTIDCFQRCFSETNCKSVNIMNELDAINITSGQTPTGIFLLRHYGSRCVTLNTTSSTFLLSKACAEYFSITTTNNLYHFASGKCVKPTATYNGATVQITDTCDQNSEFIFNERNSIKHITTTKCIHPQGGYRNPNEGTKIVLWRGCGEKRLQFFIEEKDFIKCQLLASNKNANPKSSFIAKPYWSHYEPF